MPHRFDRAVVGGDLRRRRSGARARAPWRRWRSTSCAAATGWSCSSPRRSIDTPLDPGYIKGYPPGIRENGGQYTHAAIWSVIAFAMLGDGDKAAELFSLLNPIHHASTRAGVHRYKVEPYVVCADVYADRPARRPRRLDLVHRLGRLDVSRRPRVDPRLPPARRDAAPRSLRAEGVARLRDRLPLPLRALRHRGREPARRQPWRRPRGARRRGAARKARADPARRTTARRIGCASSSARRATPSVALGAVAARMAPPTTRTVTISALRSVLRPHPAPRETRPRSAPAHRGHDNLPEAAVFSPRCGRETRAPGAAPMREAGRAPGAPASTFLAS